MNDGYARHRIAQLCKEHGLDGSVAGRLAKLLDELETNGLAPTPIRDPRRAVDVHIADSLSALSLEPVREASSIIDIGSGAGFPGLPLAAALPRARFGLMDSVRRKCDFIEAAAAAAAISNADAVCDRAEGWSAGLGAHDLVLARAVAAPATVLEYAAPLLEPEGSLVEWRGRRDPDGDAAAAAAASQLGMRAVLVHRVVAFPGASEHHLHVYRKVEPTPAGFPRRIGVARKRPLA